MEKKRDEDEEGKGNGNPNWSWEEFPLINTIHSSWGMKFTLHQPPKSNSIDQMEVQINHDQGQTEDETSQGHQMAQQYFK